ncbi:MAG: hypothetical protein CMH58_01460 [Myxococcales bacterium]|nr:hypothetical protein [Myxococcales bacterium]
MRGAECSASFVVLGDMCGRYHLTAAAQELEKLFHLDRIPPGYKPRYNIAPTQPVAVVRQHPHKGARLEPLRWGLLPHWMKEPRKSTLMINARIESIHQRRAFQGALERRRCLIPATGFYEWRRVGKSRVPHRIETVDLPIFAFAGLWERWQTAGQAPIDSVTLVTTRAVAPLAFIHQRMPVLLSPDRFDQWMMPRIQPKEAVQSWLKDQPSPSLRAIRVTDHVNNVAHDDAECLKEAQSVGPLFSRP